jgi:hypothetical protein
MNTRTSNNTGRSITKNASNLAEKALNKTKEIGQSIQNTASKVTNAVKNSVGNAQKKVEGISQMNSIKGPITKWSAMTQEFMTSNTVISKFVGFILCLILFVLIFQVGMGLLQNMFGANHSPYIINGMVQSDKELQVSANPNIPDSVPIYRSIDQNQGLEYTWNVWFNVDTNLSNSTKQKIFSKGKSKRPIARPYLNVSPGLFLSRETTNSNSLHLIINTIDTSYNNAQYEEIIIKDIPVQKWVCCTIRVQGKSVDVYINGFLKQRKNLISLPRQNYYDTYIGDNAGFKGFISSLRYYGYAVGYDEIQSLFAAGPSLKLVSNTALPASSDYFAANWYFN